MRVIQHISFVADGSAMISMDRCGFLQRFQYRTNCLDPMNILRIVAIYLLTVRVICKLTERGVETCHLDYVYAVRVASTVLVLVLLGLFQYEVDTSWVEMSSCSWTAVYVKRKIG